MIEDEELRNLYQISSEERLEQLKAGLQHLQKYPDDETTLKELRREAHSLRGDSRGVGVEAVESLAYWVEKIFGHLIRQQIVFTPQLSDRLAQGLAAINVLVQEAVTEQSSGVDIDGVIERLSAVILESQQPPPEASLDSQVEQKVELAFTQAAVPFASAPGDDTLSEIAYINNETSQSLPTLIEDETLRELYHITSLERLQNLEAGLRYLTLYPEDETTLEKLQREAHSLTGDSKSAGVETVEILARSLEEILLNLKHQQIVLTQQLSDCLEQGLAAIHCLVQEAVTGQPSGVNVTEVFDDLMEVVLELQQLQPDAVVSDEEDKEHKEDFRFQPTIDDHTEPLITSPLKAEFKGDVLQISSTFIEDEDFRDIYRTTSEERLQKLESGLLHLEKYPNDETTLEELLREAHSLKGDSRSADLESVETLTHAVEDVFLGIKHQQIILTPEVSDRLYQGLDAIAFLVHEAVTGQHSNVDTPGVLKQLMEVVPALLLPESLPIPAETLSTIPGIATQDIPTPAIGVNEPYRIDTIRVPTRELDALMTQAEELTVTKIQIAHATAEIEELERQWNKWKAFNKKQHRQPSSLGTNPYQESIQKAIDRLSLLAQENSSKLNLIAEDLREKISNLRLLPLSTLFQFFTRTVRDLAKQQAKEVELIIEGGETTADKRILEEMKDSLMHLIRNAIDHGIETPAEREKLGKPSVATIWLRGYQSTHHIVIEIADDGRGLDIEKIKQTAVKRKLYLLQELESMTSSQVYSLIFAPGFSTRTFITEISGRGIGLDVVRTNVERLKGNIEIESNPGQGCTFRLQLGKSLATLNTLLFKVKGIIHALPMEYVPGSLLVSQDEIATIEGREVITWNNQILPVVDLSDLLQISNSPGYIPRAKIEPQTNDLRTCILLKVGKEQAGFFVDRLLDTQEVVIKPQSQLLKRVRNIMGATILPSGEVCMILNPPDLLQSLQKQTGTPSLIKPKTTTLKKPIILLVEDSIYVRTQEQRLLEKAGYEVVIAVDGLDGYRQLKKRNFDAVISDVEMPNLDGLSLTAKIRQNRQYKDLPIILVTTLNSDEDKIRGAEAGANAYVIKGKFNQKFLLETLEKFV